MGLGVWTEPTLVALGLKDGWHSVVDLPYQIVRGHSDDRECPFPLACLWILPVLP
jgi:hypothetical protein